MSATQMLHKASQANVMQLSRHSADDVMEHNSMMCTRKTSRTFGILAHRAVLHTLVRDIRFHVQRWLEGV